MIKQLLSSVREYRKNTILTPVYVTIETILEIVIPTLMALLIDNGISRGDMPYVIRIGVVLIVLAAFSLLMGILAGRNAASASAGFAANLRHDMFYNVQKFSFSNIDKFSTAGIITRLTTDVTNVQNAFQMIIRLGVRAPMMMVFALIFAFRINSQLSLIFLPVVPVLGVGLWFIIMRVHPIFVRVFKTYDKLNSVVQENLRGIRVVKSFVREDFEENKFEGVSQSIFMDFVKAEKRLAFTMPLMQFCLYAIMLLLSWFGARAVIASGNDPALGFTTGELAGLITYAMQILMSLMMLSMVFVMVIISRASAERIVGILREESDLKNCDDPVRHIADGSVVFEDVTFSYRDQGSGIRGQETGGAFGPGGDSCFGVKPVLSNINLRIESGETVGILGGTGSSKSSLVQLIPRLYDVVSGKVAVGGVDVRSYDLESLRDQVAMVLQKNVLFSGTVKENLRWGNENATDEQLAHACRLAQADGFINEFEGQYDYHIEQGGANVSGGQRQRLCIARALLKNPKILILDDSTSAVDTKTDSLIRQSFKQGIPEVTKIIIAQRVASVLDADKIIVMEDGRVEAVGKHEQLLESCNIYREVYESQTHQELNS